MINYYTGLILGALSLLILEICVYIIWRRNSSPKDNTEEVIKILQTIIRKKMLYTRHPHFQLVLFKIIKILKNSGAQDETCSAER